MDEMADEKENETSTNSSTVNFAGVDEQANGIVEETMEKIPSTFDFAERSWKTDFTLIVEETRFYVAKNILALASPVFDRMFDSDFKESTTDELELPGKKADDVKEFLLAIYPNTASPMSRENALKVLPLAEEYQVLNLKQRCEEGLMGSIDVFTAIDELYRLIKEAHLYNLKELLKRCVSFVCEKPADEIQRANKEIVVPGEPLSDILLNLNDRLILKVKALESSIVLLNEQLETYKTLKNFFSKASGRLIFPILDRDLVWVGRTLRYTMDVKKRKPLKDEFIIWNTELEMKFDIKQGMFKFARSTGSCLTKGIHSTLKNISKKQIECNWEIQFAVVNTLPTNDHLSFKYRIIFNSENQTADWNFVTLSDIEDQTKGFVDNEGKAQIEVNMFMSEPNCITGTYE